MTNQLIEKFYNDVEMLGLKFPIASIAKATGFSKGTVSTYLSRNDEPSENFLKAFYKAFEKSLKIVPSGDDRYTRLLEDNDRFFKDIVKTNLVKVGYMQESILAHLKALIQMDADTKAGGSRKKREEIVQAWGKHIAASLGLPEQKDIVLNVDKKNRA